MFVIKCRFPANKSIADIIRSRYDDKVLCKIRKLEKTDLKVRKCRLDVEFLQICYDNKLMPKFLNFKVTNAGLRDSKTYRECQLKLLKQELANKKSHYKTASTEIKKLKG